MPQHTPEERLRALRAEVARRKAVATAVTAERERRGLPTAPAPAPQTQLSPGLTPFMQRIVAERVRRGLPARPAFPGQPGGPPAAGGFALPAEAARGFQSSAETGGGALAAIIGRIPGVRRIPGFEETVARQQQLRAAGAGRQEAIRRGFKEVAAEGQFPSTRIPITGLDPAARAAETVAGQDPRTVKVGVAGALEVAGDITNVIGLGAPAALRRIPGAIARTTRPIDFGGQLTAPARQVAREAPEVIVRAPGEGQITPAIRETSEQIGLREQAGIPPAPASVAPGQPVLPELPAIERIIGEDFQNNAAARIGQRAARLPGVRQTLGEQVNPSLLADTDIDRSVIAYQGLLDAGDTASKGATAQLRELGPVWQVDNSTGRVANVGIPPGASDDILDVLTFPEQYQLSPGQTEWVRRFQILRDERFRRLRAKGIEIEELTDFGEAAQTVGFDIDVGKQGEFFPRVVVGERPQGPPVARQIGARQTQQQRRAIPSAQQGRGEFGLQYVSDPNEAAEILLRGAYKLEADDDLVKFITAQPEVRALGPKAFAGKGEGTVRGQPAFARFAMPKDQAQRLGANLNATGNEMLQRVGDVNAMSIFLQTGVDPGFLLIQGIIPLFRNPVAYGRAAKTSFQALTTKGVARSKYISANMPTIQKMVSTRSVPLASSDIVEAGTTGILRRIPGAERAADAFNTFLDVARIELQKAADSRAISAVDQRAMTNVIDHMVGLSSPRALGVSPTRRQAERAVVFYASRYRRAGMALFLDAAQGGIRGQEGRRGLAQFLLGGMAGMSALATALGQGDRVTSGQMFNPTTGKFMSVRIGGTEVGIGSVAVSLIRMGGNVFAGSRRDGLGGATEAVGGTARGQAAPLTGIATDLVSGTNYFGEPVYDKQGLLTMLAERTLPFWAAPYVTEGVLDPLAPLPGPERGIAASIGTRERAVSPFDIRRDERDEVVGRAGLKTLDGQSVNIWTDLNQAQQAELTRRSASLREKNGLIDQLGLRRADEPKKARLTVERETQQEFDGRMEQIATQLESGQATKKQYDDARSGARTLRRGQRGAIWRQRAILEADNVDDLEQWIADNQRPEDAAMSAYHERQGQLIELAQSQGPLSAPAWSAIENNLRLWLNQTYGGSITGYVNEHRNDWILDLPETARKVEQRRMAEIASGVWWTNYSPRSLGSQRVPSLVLPSEGESQTPTETLVERNRRIQLEFRNRNR